MIFRKSKSELHRKALIAELEIKIDEIYRVHAKDDFMYLVAYEPARELTRLKQIPLIAKASSKGIVIPDDNWVEDEDLPRILSEVGEAWLRRELQKLFESRVEFWVKVIGPILSLVVAIVAILSKSVVVPPCKVP